jgi:hypothetical protein
MSKSILYSTSSPDERSPTDMSDYMRGLQLGSGNFYEAEKAVSKWTLQTYWDTLGRKMDSTEWIGITTPQVVNAFNLLSKNTVSSHSENKTSWPELLFISINIDCY